MKAVHVVLLLRYETTPNRDQRTGRQHMPISCPQLRKGLGRAQALCGAAGSGVSGAYEIIGGCGAPELRQTTGRRAADGHAPHPPAESRGLSNRCCQLHCAFHAGRARRGCKLRPTAPRLGPGGMLLLRKSTNWRRACFFQTCTLDCGYEERCGSGSDPRHTARQ